MTRIKAFGSETFRSLRSRNLRLFLTGQSMSQNGTWMQLVAIDILVLRLTDDGVAVGLATAARFAPMLLLGAWGGVLADRSDRHRMLLALNVAGAIVAGIFAAMVATETASVGWIYVLAAASGTVTAIENPTRRAFVVDLVDERDVPNAVGLNSAMMTGSRVVGPAIGGVLITTVGISWCFAVNALSFIPQVWLFARMDRSSFRASERLAKGRGQLREGLRYMWHTPELRLPLLMVTAIGTLSFNYPVVLPLLATRDLHGGAGTYTLLLSVMSIGSVAGALVIARRTTIDTRYLAVASLGLGVATLALAVAPSVLGASLLIVPVGLAGVLLISGSTTAIQLYATPAMRGRVLAMLSVVFLGSTPVGSPIAGWVGEHLGARWALVMGGATALAAGAATFKAAQRLGAPKPSRDAVVIEPAPLSVGAGR